MTYRNQNDSVEFTASLTQGRNGRILRVMQPVRAALASPAPALASLSDAIAGAVAIQFDRRVATVTGLHAAAPRYAAYEQFVQGLDAFTGRQTGLTDWPKAIRFLQRSVELDTTFTSAYFWLAFAYGNSGRAPLRDSLAKLLMGRRDQLAPVERFGLDYMTFPDDESKVKAAAMASELSPGSQWTWNYALLELKLGRYELAVKALRELDVDGGWARDWVIYWRRYALALHAIGRERERLDVARRAVTGNPLSLVPLLRVLGSRGDSGAILRIADSLESIGATFGSAATFPMVLREARDEAAAHGYAQAADRISVRALEWFEKRPQSNASDPNGPAFYHYVLGGHLSRLRRWDAADAAFTAAAASPESPWRREAAVELVLVAARRGDSAAVTRRLGELRREPWFASSPWWQAAVGAHLAAIRGDAPATGRLILGAPDPDRWHLTPDISPALHRHPALRQVVRP
jgi:tetratricopeptide (TPR) repeat protein